MVGARPANKAETIQPGSSQTTVLVVDDDLNISRIVEMILSSRGYNVQVANVAAFALDLMDERRPDLVLLDIMMPEMDGYELLAEMQKRHDIKPDAVIMMSALTSEADVQRARDVGICSYLKKPFTGDDLMATVGDCLVLKYQRA